MTKEVFLKIVQDRTANTLVTIVQNSILPGTTISSDEWASYHVVGEHHFEHLTVNHSVQFVDEQTGAHTQNIEALWSAAKLKLKKVRGTTKEFSPTILWNSCGVESSMETRLDILRNTCVFTPYEERR